jgi:hypothetical protein
LLLLPGHLFSSFFVGWSFFTPSTSFTTRRASVASTTSFDSIHVVYYEKGQRREHDIEVDETKPVIIGGA